MKSEHDSEQPEVSSRPPLTKAAKLVLAAGGLGVLLMAFCIGGGVYHYRTVATQARSIARLSAELSESAERLKTADAERARLAARVQAMQAREASPDTARLSLEDVIQQSEDLTRAVATSHQDGAHVPPALLPPATPPVPPTQKVEAPAAKMVNGECHVDGKPAANQADAILKCVRFMKGGRAAVSKKM